MTRLLIVLAFLCVALCSPAQAAAPLYTENFDINPGYVTAEGPNANNLSSIAFGVGTAGSPKITFGQYAGTSQYLVGTAILCSTDKGAFAIGSGDRIHSKSRNRSYVTFIDTSQAEVGQYRVSFDVSDFRSDDAPNTALYLHLFEGGATTKGHVKFQLTQQTELPALVPTHPPITTALGGQNWQVLMDNPITENGKFSLCFGLTNVGKPGDYLALVWSQVKHRGSASMPSMTIDNVNVSMLPSPPAVESAVKMPGPVGQGGDWALQDTYSDEFDTSAVNPSKWNNNPGSWGAWSWHSGNTYQGDGKLKIRMVYEPHIRNTKKLFYKSGIVRSHRQMTYGYYEARMKGCSLFPGACPAFWTYSNGRKYSGEVRYCEIDFVELQMNELDHATNERHPVNVIEMNLHLRLVGAEGKVEWRRPNSHPELCANAWVAPWDPRDDFHVYGCDVTEESITWFIDGKQVAKKPNTYWHEPMNITLSLGLRHPHIGWKGQDMQPLPQNATAVGFPTEMEVDYVRVWKRK